MEDDDADVQIDEIKLPNESSQDSNLCRRILTGDSALDIELSEAFMNEVAESYDEI